MGYSYDLVKIDPQESIGTEISYSSSAQEITNLGYVNKKNETLINALVKKRNNIGLEADKALSKLIPLAKDTIDVPDSDGNTAFINAVKGELFDIARYLEHHGAKRAVSSSNNTIVSDSDGEYNDNNDNNDNNANNDKYQDLQKPKRPSIFAKQTTKSNNSEINDIHSIVKAFVTKENTNTTDGNSIVKTDLGYNNNNNKNINNLTNSDYFVQNLAKEMVGDKSNQELRRQVGGAKKINNKTSTKVVGKRKMVGFSELSDKYDTNEGINSNEMKKISRATINQKNKFHEEAVEKISAHLSKKDPMTAKAVKAIIYEEIKNTNKEASGLDRAAILLKAITKDKVNEVLKQKDTIKKIVDYLEQKNKGSNKNPVINKKNKSDFESSVVETSDNSSFS
nr:putative uncharacterized protein DDB_G0282133 [Hydra vulgaris]